MKPMHPLYIIGLALHMSVAIYVGIIFFLSSNGGWVNHWAFQADQEVISYALVFMAINSACLSVLFPRFLKIKISSPKPAYDLGVDETSRLFFDFSVIDPPLQTLTIIRMALAESIAIFGFVVAMLNQSAFLIVPFAVLGFLIQVAVGPFGKLIGMNKQ